MKVVILLEIRFVLVLGEKKIVLGKTGIKARQLHLRYL